MLEVLEEDGFDLSGNKPHSVFELFKHGKLYDHVITVCAYTETKCPIFPGITQRWHWPFPDPAAAEGSHAEKIDQVRKIREMIKAGLIGLFGLDARRYNIRIDALLRKPVADRLAAPFMGLNLNILKPGVMQHLF